MAVPHAGRYYPPALLTQSRLTPEQLALLEDRFADALVGDLHDSPHQLLVAETARAWIDLNRDPREIDPAMIARNDPGLAQARLEARACDPSKTRAGLGLLPSRVPRIGDIYRERLTLTDIQARVATVHTVWHQGIEQAMHAAWVAHGVAILVDLHSMPTIPRGQSGHGLRLVVGDRHGQSCDTSLARCAVTLSRKAGLATDLNRPYAGAYTLARHGRPSQHFHAIQLEFDRALYLDDTGEIMITKAQDLRLLLRQLCDTLADIGWGLTAAQAAE